MKKVLFGIMTLSMTAFAANPGTIIGEGAKTASVPVRVIAEVVKPASALVITDEAGTILDELLLDHKIVGGTATGDSVIAKNFKVKVTGTDGDVDKDITSTGENSHMVTINLDNTTTTLTKVGGTKTIKSTLRLVNGVNLVESNEYIAGLKSGEHLGTITSTIAAESLPVAEAGAYDNKVTGAMPTLSVTYSANGTFTK
ncbi:hypothetical protein H5J22_11530 [Cetobacterium sp. 8H]|uniref:hypothetical protein n=1 Tax=Cetobacterium sp. 8H TaxID=2759681 RepID=UPI00163CDFDB|nr:hypothetical protein [Cetobacterium sp. 8H]MBC2852028.1 hypothetical protein [Cetobacterium sp. 8H]